MKPRFILGLDQGTTGSTALVFDVRGAVVGKGYQEIHQSYPQPGWVEHDPEELYQTSLSVMRQALHAAGIEASQLVAMGITNQRETSIVWDKTTGHPIHPAIVWQCRRTTEVCEALKAKGLEPEVTQLTGLLLDPYFSATKISWILDHVDGARTRAENGELAFGTVDSWLLWKFTPMHAKVHLTDFTNASRTLLYDIHQKDWSTRLCEIFRVPKKLLPNVKNSMGFFATTEASQLGSEVAVCGVAGDQQAALFGHRAVLPGQAKCTFGTGAFAVMFGGSSPIRSKHRLLVTLAADARGAPAYALEGSVFIAGAIIGWLRDGLGIIERADETDAIARSVPDTGGVYIVPAFVGLGAPYWDAQARGAIFGITRGTTRAHLVRAALESIAYQVAELIEAMEKDLATTLTELQTDGGAISNDYLAQFLSDLLGKPLIRSALLEMTGFGAARLAGLSKRFWNEETTPSGESKRFNPRSELVQRVKLLSEWKSCVARVRTH